VLALRCTPRLRKEVPASVHDCARANGIHNILPPRKWVRGNLSFVEWSKVSNFSEGRAICSIDQDFSPNVGRPTFGDSMPGVSVTGGHNGAPVFCLCDTTNPSPLSGRISNGAHSTVIRACNLIERRMMRNATSRLFIEQIEGQITAAPTSAVAAVCDSAFDAAVLITKRCLRCWLRVGLSGGIMAE